MVKGARGRKFSDQLTFLGGGPRKLSERFQLVITYANMHSGKKKVERIGRIPSHGVLSAFGIDQESPFRDHIDSLPISHLWQKIAHTPQDILK